jgi:gamma-glutamylcysteine synthetase
MVAEDGRKPGRPRTDPRSILTGPDLEGVGPLAPVPRTSPAVFRTALDDAVEHATRAALRASPPGPVGLEVEGHLVDLEAPGRRVPWPRVRAAVESVRPLPGRSRLTVEPGGQLELSGPPAPDVAAAVAAIRADREVLRTALAGARLGLAPLGADPVRLPQRVNPAARYAAMEQHFAAVGCAEGGRAMMTSTASVQVNLEAGPASRWSARVALAHQLGAHRVALQSPAGVGSGRPGPLRTPPRRQ